MKFYKVVENVEGRYYSYMKAMLPRECVVEYLKGEWVKGLYPLMVFDDSTRALEFLHDAGDWGEELWECEVRGTMRASAVVPLWSIYSTHSGVLGSIIREFWYDEYRLLKKPWPDDGRPPPDDGPTWRLELPPLESVPSSTCLADEVKLIKRRATTKEQVTGQ